MALLERLEAIQSALKLSNRAFAAKIGVSHGTWSQTRQHRLRLNDAVLSGVIAAFPELEDEVVAYTLHRLRSRTESHAITA